MVETNIAAHPSLVSLRHRSLCRARQRNGSCKLALGHTDGVDMADRLVVDRLCHDVPTRLQTGNVHNANARSHTARAGRLIGPLHRADA